MRPLYSSLAHWERKSSLEGHVVLVDANDLEIGTLEKIKAHEQGLLHRAFSIFIFNRKGDMLLQKRAIIKYHSAGLWTNACCSHPMPGEGIEEAAHRRLSEELGFDCVLKKMYAFTYQVELENGLFEHEYDHVFYGVFDGKIEADPNELSAWEYRPLGQIGIELEEQPSRFTEWFKIAFPEVIQRIDQFVF